MTEFEKKAEDLYLDFSHGFGVRWDTIPMIKVDGEWVADVDFTAPEYVNPVLYALATTPGHYSGNHIRFIRQALGMSYQNFGQWCHEYADTIKIWEKRGNEKAWITSWGLAKDLRFFILDKLGVAPDIIVKFYREFRDEPHNDVTVELGQIALSLKKEEESNFKTKKQNMSQAVFGYHRLRSNVNENGQHRVDEIVFGEYFPEGGGPIGKGEMAISWFQIPSGYDNRPDKIVPHLTIYSDAWYLLPRIEPVLKELSKIKEITPEEFCKLLDQIGFQNLTK